MGFGGGGRFRSRVTYVGSFVCGKTVEGAQVRLIRVIIPTRISISVIRATVLVVDSSSWRGMASCGRFVGLLRVMCAITWDQMGHTKG